MNEQRTATADLQRRLDEAERRSAEFERAAKALQASEAQYQALLAAAPVPFVVVAPNSPDFTIIGVNDVYVASTHSTREALLGQKLLDVFIYDPDHPGLRGSGLVARSLDRVIETRQTDVMSRLRYDIPAADGALEEHWWQAVNAPVFDADGNVIALIHQATRITDHYRAEQAARESEKRQTFLLRLSDAIRSLADPRDIQGETTRLLREELQAGWCYYVDWDLEKKTGTVLRDSVSEGLPSLAGTHDVSDAPEFLQLLATNAVLTISDYACYEQLPAHIRQKFTAVGFRSMMLAPLVRRGRLIATLLVGQTEIRDWSASEASLLVEIAERTWAAIERARAEAALRENEEGQAFQLQLSDALASLTDPAEIQAEASRLLAERLDVGWCYFNEFDERGTHAIVLGEYRREGLPSMVGVHDLSGERDFLDLVHAGTEFAFPDWESFKPFSQAAAAIYRQLGMRSALGTPLLRNNRLVAVLVAGDTRSRRWSRGDAELLRGVIERTWFAIERARFEAALREREERFQQFADASAAVLWIRDAETLALEFVSPGVASVYGVEADALLGDLKKWAAMIVPEDREEALKQLDAARHGATFVHEFRVQRSTDAAFRWIRNTGFPLRTDERIPRIGGIAEDITETRLLVEHQGILLAELQHRVRNIMGMIRSIANRTASGAQDVAEYREMLEGRLLALARVQALLTRQANAGGALRDIVREEVAAQAHHADQFDLAGPDVVLAPKAVEVLTLAFHELSTNALKYGALSVPEGRLTIRWAPFEKRGRAWLAVDWIEEGTPHRASSPRKGFGSELIEARIPYELGGKGDITITPGGAHCHMEFPLEQAESILETDAPIPATIYGGTLDMTGSADLTGRRVLVVEDDYYMARDTAAALQGAGAEVLGPCPSEDATLDLLEDDVPTHAVLDLNLGGGGPQFAIAEELERRGVPFIFLTGYDPDVIPTALAKVPRLQKPVPFRTIVEAVAALAPAGV